MHFSFIYVMMPFTSLVFFIYCCISLLQHVTKKFTYDFGYYLTLNQQKLKTIIIIIIIMI